MSTTRLCFPCLFSIRPTAAGRVHVGRVVVEPALLSEGATPQQAVHRLGELVTTALREPDTPLALRLCAIPEDVVDERLQLTLPWRGKPVPTTVRALRWESGGHGFVALPRVGATLPVSPGLAPEAREVAVQQAINRWFKAVDPDDPDPLAEVEPYGDRRGDRIVWLDVRAQVRWELPSADALENLFRALAGGEKMDGAKELRKVARALDALYPDRLRRDVVPDARVEPLRRLVFEEPEPVPTVLVGPSGSGKTTLVHAAVRRHLDHLYATDPKAVRAQARLYHLDPNRVIAGMSIVGQWQRRLGAILEHLVSPRRERPRDGLFIDQPLALARVGRSAGSRMALTSLLRPWVERRRLPIVLEATPEAWTRFEELDRAFADLFRVVRVDTPPWQDALARAFANVEAAERATGAAFRAEALRRLAELERRFPAGRGLPGGLVDRIELLAARAAGAEVTGATVDAAFGDASGLRPELFTPGAPLPDAPLRARIAARLVGQPAAVDAIAEVVHVLRAGLARPQKPLAAWLLVGPTGVGKTEAAKVLAGLLFSDPSRLVRLDMNEYVDAGAVSRLLGDGVTEGHLPARLRRHPVAVLLLDEIEKAHPAVHDLLLQLLDEGRITDASGRTSDLQRVAVLLTSNVGASEIARGAGFEHHRASVGAAYRAAVERAFRPELVNRLDRVLVFAPLGLPEIRRVARLQVDRILAREGFLRRALLLDLDATALDGLARAGFDPALGARALKRVLEAALVGRIADLLATAPLDRPVVVRVRPDGDGIRAEARLLRYADARGAPPAVVALDEPALRALRDALPPIELRPVEVDGGTVYEGGDVAALHARIDEALGAFDEEPADVWVDDRHLARIAARPRHFRSRARARWRAEPFDWMNAVSFRSVRAFLLDGATGAGWEGFHGADDPLLPFQVRALGTAASAPVRLHLHGLAEAGAPLAPAFAPYLDALAAALGRAGAHVTRWAREPAGWAPHGADRPRTAELWDVEGPGFAALLRAEEGVHLAFLAEEPPVALVVTRVPAGPPEDLPRSEADLVVRLLAVDAHLRDLPTGLATDATAAEIGVLLPQIWAVRAEEP